MKGFDAANARGEWPYGQSNGRLQLLFGHAGYEGAIGSYLTFPPMLRKRGDG